MNEEKTCNNCKHKEKDIKQFPCYVCGKKRKFWEPIPEDSDIDEDFYNLDKEVL